MYLCRYCKHNLKSRYATSFSPSAHQPIIKCPDVLFAVRHKIVPSPSLSQALSGMRKGTSVVIEKESERPNCRAVATATSNHEKKKKNPNGTAVVILCD